MAFKIFQDKTVIRIIDTSGKNEPIQYNPSQVKYYPKDGKFIFFDGIEQQDFNNHGYQDFTDRLGNPFASEEAFIDYLNGFINRVSTGTQSSPAPSLDVDNSNRVSRNTIFGDKITAKRIPQLAAQFQYPLASDDVQPPETGNGGQVIQEGSLLKLVTDAQVGSFANLQSSDTIRYIPGFECYFFCTPDFNEPTDGQTQFIGVMDDDTGFAFGYNGLDFVFMYRRDGADTYFPIDLVAFEELNGYALNPLKGNVYLITYGYLGYAPAKLEVVPPRGGLAELYTFEYPNAHDKTHLSQTFLPIRGELNNGAGATPMTLSLGSINAGIVNGGEQSTYTFARAFNYASDALPVNGNTELVAFRNKTVFGGITNYVAARLFNFNVAQDLNKSSVVYIYRNPVVLNTPTWADIDVDSVLEFSEDIAIDFAASLDTFYTQALFRIDTLDKEVEGFKFDLKPGDVAVFAVKTIGQGEVLFSNFWKELF
jgi:hypothetical protein